jgi:hypothetical protein
MRRWVGPARARASPAVAFALRPPLWSFSECVVVSSAIEECELKPDPCKKLAEEIDELINRDKRLEQRLAEEAVELENAGKHPAVLRLEPKTPIPSGGRHGLKARFREQINGKNGPGTKSWTDHDQQFKDQQKGLRNRLDEFNRNNCGDRVQLPDDAWVWASRPAPLSDEWQGAPKREMLPPAEPPTDLPPPPPILDVPDDSGYWSRLEKATGLTGGALIAYLIVSEGSRFVFPPRNFAPIP